MIRHGEGDGIEDKGTSMGRIGLVKRELRRRNT
jgi:hypothetical protein